MAVRIQRKWLAFVKDPKSSKQAVLNKTNGKNTALDACKAPQLVLSTENADPQPVPAIFLKERSSSEDSLAKSKLHHKLGIQQAIKPGKFLD